MDQTTLSAGSLQSRTYSTDYADNHAIAPHNPSFTDQVSARLDNLQNLLGETMGDLSMCRDRTFGQSPENVSGSKGAGPVSQARAEAIVEHLDRLIDMAGANMTLARGLNSRV